MRPIIAIIASLFVLAFASPATASYKVVDVTPPALITQGLTGASGGYEVGNEITGYYQCGRGHCPITRAYHWTGASSNAIDLTPAAYFASHVSAISKGVEVGWVQQTQQRIYHAAQWRGTAASFVDLNNPADCCGSQLLAIDGRAQVGATVDANLGLHAAAWAGTVTSEIRLGGFGATYSTATGVSDGKLVGQAYTTAMEWTGNTYTPLALPCNGCPNAQAFGIYDDGVVGYGNLTAGNFHAYFWPNSTTNAIDLNPPNNYESFALAIYQKKKVGYTLNLNQLGSPIFHAAVWSGVASKFQDLQKYLPSSYAESSALAVDEKGNIVGAAIDGSNVIHAVIWVKQ
jgi:hypothetical protein